MTPLPFPSERIDRTGFTLIEVMIVLALMAILLTVALPAIGPTETQRLYSAADLLASDLRLAQSLAVRDNTDIALTLATNGWKIEHVGSGLAPELPTPPLGGVGTGYQIDVSMLVGRDVVLAGFLVSSGTAVGSATFSGTGRTTAIEDTRFWITLGAGDQERSIPLVVSAATGLVTAGSIRKGPPPAGG